MMSKERELLNKAIEMIQIVPMMASIGKVPPNFGSELILEIQKLLAQPEQEPIEDGELEVWYSQHSWAMDKQEYIWGFRDAEKAHGIGE